MGEAEAVLGKHGLRLVSEPGADELLAAYLLRADGSTVAEAEPARLCQRERHHPFMRAAGYLWAAAEARAFPRNVKVRKARVRWVAVEGVVAVVADELDRWHQWAYRSRP
jgi:hypothetical protein